MVVELNGGNAGREIAGWQIGYGNPKKMVKTVEKSGAGEEETIKTLVEEISRCEKVGAPVITPGRRGTQALRTRLLLLGEKNTPLRRVGFVHVQGLLEEHFLDSELPRIPDVGLSEAAERMGVGEKGAEKVELLRKIFLRVGSLI
ncbi:hypothetical protein AKJ48_02825, partial [candidate division MSBL1 archaeon SCGC-AAA261O19]